MIIPHLFFNQPINQSHNFQVWILVFSNCGQNLLQVSKVRSLEGRPKLIFIEACKGLDSNSLMTLLMTESGSLPPMVTGILLLSKQDVFVGFATVPGFVSFTSVGFSQKEKALLDINISRAGSPRDINLPRAGSPRDINVPRAGSPGDINVPRAGSPGDKNVPRAASPVGHKCT